MYHETRIIHPMQCSVTPAVALVKTLLTLLILIAPAAKEKVGFPKDI